MIPVPFGKLNCLRATVLVPGATMQRWASIALPVTGQFDGRLESTAMNLSAYLRRVRCPECCWYAVWGPEQMLRALRSQGMLRRETQPAPEIILQLITVVLGQLTCPDCQSRQLALSPYDDTEDSDWAESRCCEVCRAAIPRERLEVFPRTRRCAKCQDQPVAAAVEDDFCPRCGGLLQLRLSRSAGTSRYVSHCPSCNYRG
jgi:hypothetical protein